MPTALERHYAEHAASLRQELERERLAAEVVKQSQPQPYVRDPWFAEQERRFNRARAARKKNGRR